MNRTLLTILVLVGLLVFGGVISISAYNQLVAADEGVEQSWGDLQSQYQRRADLIPNLVATVQGAADFEQETLTAVIEARAKATSISIDGAALNDPSTMQAFANAQQELSGALSRLLVSVERYPQLTATTNFQDLQAQLEGTENRITVARRDYNAAVRGYNTRVRRFPTVLVASMTGFERRMPFEAAAGSDVAPSVSFD